jgi:protein SCO1
MARPSLSPLPWIVAVLAMLAGGGVAWLQRGPAPDPQSVEGLLWPSPRSLSDFSLRDQRDTPFTPASLQSKWTLMFFGFTHCPDICPNTLNVLKRASPGLPPGTQVVFVSVDPERDTPEKLASYVSYFDPAFLGVSGEPAAVERFTRSLGVLAVRTEPDATGNYSIDHTASVLVVDPQARLVGTISQPFTAESLQAVYLKIREFVERQS